ncbi:MAG: dihydrofolate reductase family protein [Acidimicrobiia bacterium]
MSKVRVHNLAVSLDGYAAGPDQSLDEPLGVDGERLHDWIVATRTFGGDATGLDEEFAARGNAGIGATIMGRNMFGPIRGDWGNDTWRGWWGEEPPFHHEVFVLTHHPHAPIPMRGGTTFNFVDAGIEVALERALDAAGGRDVRIGGGASTIQQYLRAGLIDEMHVAFVPILLGGGERLLEDLDRAVDGYECVELVCSPAVAHARFVRTAAP